MRTANVSEGIRNKILRSRERFWRPDDFEGSPDAVAQALTRLARAHELRRVRRGLYWRGTITPFGMVPPSPYRLVEELVGETGTGPAGWSAALALGLSTQVPRDELVAVVGRAPRDAPGIRFVSRSASTKRRDERLRPTEVALLEVLRDWNDLIECPPREAHERLGRLMDEGEVRVERLVRASATEPPVVRQRLRSLLDALGRSGDADRVRPAISALLVAR